MEAHNVYRAFQNQTGPPPRREPTRPLPNIACEECRRKKTRCDMRRPACSLCVRIGEDCNYPPRRRSGRKQKHATTQSTAWGLRPSKLGSSLSQQRVPPASNSSSSLSLHHSMHTSSNNLPALDENSFADPVAAFGPTVPMDPIDSQFGADLLPYNVGFAEDYNYRDDAAADEFARWLDVEALSTRSPFTGARTYAEGQSLGMPPLASSSGLPHGPGPSTWTTISTPSDSSSKIQLDIPRTLAIELIELFFQRVHCFLPIFTRRVFDARYGDLIADEAQSICTVSCESAMILHSIFGLSARYSNTTILAADDRGNRGTQFVTQAMKIYSQTHDQERDNESKFTYLTGLILLTFSTLQTGPSQLAWDMRKDCVRLAHDLDLSNADQDIIYGSADPNAMTWDEWNSREERRRLWWIVWDLDTFMSAVSATPFAIEEPPTHIFLPIPDRAWDKNERVVSVPMSSDVMSTCESLCRSPNQSEWAWFLVCTAVMRQIVAAVSEPTTDERVMKDTEATLTCFALALPEKFQLDAESLNFDETSFEASNWVLNTAILLQCGRSFLMMYSDGGRPSSHRWSSMFEQSLPSQSRQGFQERQSKKCHSSKNEIARALCLWPPQYFARCSPLLVGSLAGPGLVHVTQSTSRGARQDRDSSTETIKMALRRVGRTWDVAKVLSDALDNLAISGDVLLEAKDTLSKPTHSSTNVSSRTCVSNP